MVLPLVDEYKPKCYMCYKEFDDIEKLRIHQQSDHKKILEKHNQSSNERGNNTKHEPAPGDVTMF